MNPTEALERARAVIRRQHKTMATQQTYLHWLRHYMAALGEMPQTLTSEQRLERFLTELALKEPCLGGDVESSLSHPPVFLQGRAGHAA